MNSKRKTQAHPKSQVQSKDNSQLQPQPQPQPQKGFKVIQNEDKASVSADNVVTFKSKRFEVDMEALLDVFDQMARSFFVRGKGAASAHYYLSRILSITPEEARHLIIDYKR